MRKGCTRIHLPRYVYRKPQNMAKNGYNYGCKQVSIERDIVEKRLLLFGVAGGGGVFSIFLGQAFRKLFVHKLP